MQQTICKSCSQQFQLGDDDLAYYQEMQVPPPTHCPECRWLRRLIWRNERMIYKRKCSATGKEILSVYSEDKPFPVYEPEYWYGDKWDAMQYGRDFDFSRPFFEQFQELMHQVPQLARSVVNNHNCDYVNQCGWCKNCYLIFEADGDEDCLYSNNIYDSKTCIDTLHCTKCQLCYECINCTNCYNLKFSQDSRNCSDSWFLKDCIGCTNCFGCVNLRNKQYYFLNQPCSKEEYERKLAAIDLSTTQGLHKMRSDFNEFLKKYPQKYIHGTQNENSTGDYLWNTQNCQECYDVNNAQDCKFVTESRKTKKVYDMLAFGANEGAEFCYENHELGAGVRSVYFSDQIWLGCYNVYYSKLCIQNSHDIFGCVGLKHASYCILNKQYSKEDYEALKAKIIEHMKSTGEWGEFYPMNLSPYGYNETLAQYYFPLTKEAATAKGLKWKDKDMTEYRPATCSVPLRIEEVEDSILSEVLACADCGKNYRVVAQELGFYRNAKLPIPLKCHDCRHYSRMSMRNPRKLHDRNCQKCQVPVKTTYSSAMPYIVYCEKCYQDAAI